MKKINEKEIGKNMKKYEKNMKKTKEIIILFHIFRPFTENCLKQDKIRNNS